MMIHYVVLANFTDQGIRDIKDTAKRSKAFRDVANSFGIKIKDIYWTLGPYDVVLTMEAPDEPAMASLVMKVGSLGNLRCQTLRAFDEQEMNSLLAKV